MSRDHQDARSPQHPTDTAESHAGKAALTDRMIRRAQRKNPKLYKRLKFSLGPFGNSPVDSEQFALSVAERQAAAGVAVDGIAGRETLRVITGADPFDFLDGPPGKSNLNSDTHRLIGESSHRQALSPTTTRVTAVIGRADRVSPQTQWTLCTADGEPLPGGAARPETFGEQATALIVSLPIDEIPTPIYVQATTAKQHLAPEPVADEPLDMTGLED